MPLLPMYVRTLLGVQSLPIVTVSTPARSPSPIQCLLWAPVCCRDYSDWVEGFFWAPLLLVACSTHDSIRHHGGSHALHEFYGNGHLCCCGPPASSIGQCGNATGHQCNHCGTANTEEVPFPKDPPTLPFPLDWSWDCQPWP